MAQEWVEWVPGSSDMVVSSCCEPSSQLFWFCPGSRRVAPSGHAVSGTWLSSTG